MIQKVNKTVYNGGGKDWDSLIEAQQAELIAMMPTTSADGFALAAEDPAGYANRLAAAQWVLANRDKIAAIIGVKERKKRAGKPTGAKRGRTARVRAEAAASNPTITQSPNE